jgi:transcriptional regulator with XRE-family HTH domain
MRQTDLAAKARVSRQAISRLERGQFLGQSVQVIERIVTALDGSLSVEVRWRGEQLDRLIDSVHASVQAAVAEMLSDRGWVVRVEVSFNRYGERGRCDILAIHARSGTLLVVEVKSRLGDLQETLGRLDTKARLGPHIARELGWATPTFVVPALVIAEGRTARRVVALHEPLFRRFDVRGRAAVAWPRRPTTGVTGLLWFQPVSPNSRGTSAVRRSPRTKGSDARLT